MPRIEVHDDDERRIDVVGKILEEPLQRMYAPG
jgi:hypothetical protein